MTDPADKLGLAGLDPTRRFSDRAADYMKHRPDYPAAAIDCILEGLPNETLVADVGAGTGISARQIADRGVSVIAIEPNREMRDAATPHPRVTWREGTAEATGLESGSVDLVLCAQAFHWFRQAGALAEFHRVLRPGGRLALMWNTRSRIDPLTRGYIAAIREVNGEHPAEKRTLDPEVLGGMGGFTPLERHAFDHAQALDRDGLIGRATSASYVPKRGESFDQLVRLLDALHAHYRDAAGRVVLRYVTEVWLARRLAA
jgi:SAM-dependent methyltransferase